MQSLKRGIFTILIKVVYHKKIIIAAADISFFRRNSESLMVSEKNKNSLIPP